MKKFASYGTGILGVCLVLVPNTINGLTLLGLVLCVAGFALYDRTTAQAAK